MNREGKADKNKNDCPTPNLYMPQPFCFLPNIYCNGHHRPHYSRPYYPNIAFFRPPNCPQLTQFHLNYSQNLHYQNSAEMEDMKNSGENLKDNSDKAKKIETNTSQKAENINCENSHLTDKSFGNSKDKMDVNINDFISQMIRPDIPFNSKNVDDSVSDSNKAKSDLFDWAKKGKMLLQEKSISEISNYLENKERNESWLESFEGDRNSVEERLKEEYKDFLGTDSEDDLIDDLNLLDFNPQTKKEADEINFNRNENSPTEGVPDKTKMESNYHSVVNKLQNFFAVMDNLGCGVDAFLIHKNNGNAIFDDNGNISADLTRISEIQAKLCETGESPKQNEIVITVEDEDLETDMNDATKTEELSKSGRVKYTREEISNILGEFSNLTGKPLPEFTVSMRDMLDDPIYRTSSAKERKVVEKVRFSNLGTSTDAMIIGKDHKIPLNELTRHINRLTPGNYGECMAACEEAISRISSKQQLVSESLLNSVVSSSVSVIPFSFLINDLTKSYKSICSGILKGCRGIFDARNDPDTKLIQLKNRLEEFKGNSNMLDNKEVENLNIDIVDAEKKHRSRVLRSVCLYGWMYNLDLVPKDEFFAFLTKLTLSDVSADIICLCRLLTVVGQKLVLKESGKLAEIVDKLSDYTKHSDMTVTFTVIDLIDDYKADFKLADSHAKDNACIAEIRQSSKDYYWKNRSAEDQMKVKQVSKVTDDGFILVGKNSNFDAKFGGKWSGNVRSAKKVTESTIVVNSRFDMFTNSVSADDPLDSKWSPALPKNLPELSADECYNKANEIYEFCINDIESAVAVFNDLSNTRSSHEVLANLYLIYCDLMSSDRVCLVQFYERLHKLSLVGSNLICEMVRSTLEMYDSDDSLGHDFPIFVADFARIVLICCGHRPDIRALFGCVQFCKKKYNFIYSILTLLKTNTSTDVVRNCLTTSKLDLSDFEGSDVDELFPFIREYIN